MKTNSVGFIGGGRITGIFLQAFANEGIEFQKVVVFDINVETVASLKASYPFIETGDLNQAASQPIVLIALHPPVIMETLDKIAEVVNRDTIVVSLAPKITLEKIASKLKTRNIVRMIPNATSYINKGYNPVAFHPEIGKTDQKQVKALLKVLGKTFETEESKLESYAIMSAMLPTFFWFQFQELETIAQQIGLTPEEASATVKSTLKRAIKLYFESELKPSDVMNLVPVKPIGEHESQIAEIYRNKLTGLFEKIKP